MLPDAFRALLARAPEDLRIALVGASEVRSKFGWIILQDLARKGFDVVPVNPSAARIGDRAAYASVAAIPGGVDLINVVVPPGSALEMLEALPVPPPPLWFQPGAYDARVVARARALTPDVVAGPCIMVET